MLLERVKSESGLDQHLGAWLRLESLLGQLRGFLLELALESANLRIVCTSALWTTRSAEAGATEALRTTGAREAALNAAHAGRLLTTWETTLEALLGELPGHSHSAGLQNLRGQVGEVRIGALLRVGARSLSATGRSGTASVAATGSATSTLIAATLVTAALGGVGLVCLRGVVLHVADLFFQIFDLVIKLFVVLFVLGLAMFFALMSFLRVFSFGRGLKFFARFDFRLGFRFFSRFRGFLRLYVFDWGRVHLGFNRVTCH